MLANFETIAFIPSTDIHRSASFYRDVLGLPLERDDGFASVFRAGGRMLRIVAVEMLAPSSITMLGWEVPDLPGAMADLSSRGVEFLHYPGFDQDEQGVWTTPGGDRVAWFADPDGNVLSLSTHV